MKRLLGFWGPLVLLSFMPVMASFAANRFEVAGGDLVMPAIMSVLAATIVTAVFWRLWRRDQLAGYVAGALLTLLFTSQYDDRLKGLLPTLDALVPLPAMGLVTDWLADIGLMAILGVAAYWLGRLVSLAVAKLKIKPREAAAAVAVAVIATFMLQVIPLAATLVTEWPQFNYRPPKIAAGAAKGATKPDIYYIILDRYASSDVLKQQFNFDNTDFTTYLNDNKYYVNPASQTNYPYTAMSVASTMSADYLTDMVKQFSGSAKQTTVPFDQTVRNSPVAAYLKQAGYSYQLIGNWYETSNQSPLADQTYQQTGRLTLLGHDFILNNFAKNALVQSPLWRFLQPGLGLGSFKIFNYTNLGDVDMAHYALNKLKTAAAQPAGGRFIFAHILLPHDPYNFHADGSIASDNGIDDNGRPVKQKYLDQLQYANSQMKDILSTINRQSQQQAVVVLQSDEGPYPHQLNDKEFDFQKASDELQAGDMRAWSDLNLQMKYGNLAAYHLPGVETGAAVEAADNVNIFRLIFNHYFDAGLPYLPDCHYAYPDGRNRPMVFTDITQRLTGSAPDSRCGADGQVKP